MEFVTLSEKEFTEFEEKHVLGSFYQTVKWGKLKEYNGWKYFLVGVKENKKIIGASLILKKKIFSKLSIIYAPRGFLIDYNNDELLKFFTNNIKKFAKKEHAIFVKIDPTIIYKERDREGKIIVGGIDNSNIIDKLKKFGYKCDSSNLQPRFVFTLSVKDKTSHELFEAMENTTKQIIRKNNNLGLNIRELKKEELNIFKDVMQKTADRRGFIDRPLSYYEHMYDIFGKDMKILVAEVNIKEYIDNSKKELDEQNNKIKELEESLNNERVNVKKINNKIKEINFIINSLNKKINKYEKIYKENKKDVLILGALMFIMHSKEILSLFGGAYGEYREFMPAYYLNWHMIEYSALNGYHKYNFYGIDEFTNKDDPMYGLYDFKRGFNGVVEEYIGEYNLITSKFWFFVYNFIYGKVYTKLKSIKIKKN